MRMRLKKDRVSVVAAGVAFFSLLALFPLITFAISIYAYFADPIDAQNHINAISRVLPPQAWKIVSGQIQAVAAAEPAQLGWGILASIFFALYTAGAGIRAMMKAVNLAYGEEEKRNALKFLGLAIAMTLGSAILIYAALGLIIGLTAALQYLPFETAQSFGIRTLPWLSMILMFFVALVLFYSVAPSRRMAKFRWIVPGALMATLFWIAISFGFTIFVAKFGRFSTVYGSLAAVIILLIWFWLTAYAVIAGATLNAELEHQTIADTTRNHDRKMGVRGAHVADTFPKKELKTSGWFTLIFVLILGRLPGRN